MADAPGFKSRWRQFLIDPLQHYVLALLASGDVQNYLEGDFRYHI